MHDQRSRPERDPSIGYLGNFLTYPVHEGSRKEHIVGQLAIHLTRPHVKPAVHLVLSRHEVIPESTRNPLPLSSSSVLREPHREIRLTREGFGGQQTNHVSQITVGEANSRLTPTQDVQVFGVGDVMYLTVLVRKVVVMSGMLWPEPLRVRVIELSVPSRYFVERIRTEGCYFPSSGNRRMKVGSGRSTLRAAGVVPVASDRVRPVEVAGGWIERLTGCSVAPMLTSPVEVDAGDRVEGVAGDLVPHQRHVLELEDVTLVW